MAVWCASLASSTFERLEKLEARGQDVRVEEARTKVHATMLDCRASIAGPEYDEVTMSKFMANLFGPARCQEYQ